MQFKSLFEKLNKKLNKKLSLVLAVSALIIVSAGVFAISKTSKLSYVVYADGEAICTVEKKEVYEKAIILLNEKHEELGIKEQADVKLSIKRASSSLRKLGEAELCDVLYDVYKNDYVRAYTITLNGVSAGTLSTYEEASRVVDLFNDHISNKLTSSDASGDFTGLTADFKIQSVYCRKDKVTNSEYICRHMLNDGSYSDEEQLPSADRIVANGSMALLYADKNYVFGLIKNEAETELPVFDFVFNIGELNANVDVKTYHTEVYSEVIEYETIYIETDELFVGESRVETEGENGFAENVYEIAYIDGKEVSRTLVTSDIIEEPVNRVEYVGTKELPSTKPTGAFIWPLQERFVITSSFGDSGASRPTISPGSHKGLDIAGVPEGTPVYAADGGTVTFAGENGTYGLLVIVQHENNVQTRYAHLKFISVKEGDKVYQGQVLGGVGETGRVTGVHLHFEVRMNTGSESRPNWVPLNPTRYLPKTKPWQD